MTSDEKHILLFGEPRIVSEFARLLEKKNKVFTIINSTGDLVDDILNEELLLGDEDSEEVDSVDKEVNDYYDEFAENVVFSVREVSSDVNVDCIIDCSTSGPFDKVMVLQELAEMFPSAPMVCSTLTCTATKISSHLPLASQVVGAPLIPGFTEFSTLELAPSVRTREHSQSKVVTLFTELGFTVEVVEDRIALVFPRMICMLINEAAFAVMERVATATDIDAAMKLGVNYPKGLLEWADLIGVDLIVTILDSLYEEYKEPRYRCCVLLRQHYRAGWFGQSTGRGFYTYLPMN